MWETLKYWFRKIFEGNERLRISEKKFSLIFEHSPFAIVLVKMPSTVIVDVNPSFERIFGFTRAEAVGKTSVELGMHQDLAGRERIREEFQRKGKVRNVENSVFTKTGKPLVISNNLDSIEIEGENYVLVTLEDTTERRRAEHELKKAIQVREDFLSIASHELKTPLTTLKLQAQMRQQKVAKKDYSDFTPERLPKIVRDDEKQINRLVRLVENMLDISRFQAGKLELNREDTDLSIIINDVTERFTPQFKESGIEITVDAPPGVTGRWDPFRIEQVAANLILNAMKYGGGKPVHISVTKARTYARIMVRDQGMGIAKIDQQRIFRQFERAVKDAGVSGLGLGLYITKEIIEAHGGNIRVESELEKGSTFMVDLPL